MMSWIPTINDVASVWADSAIRACWQGGLMIAAVWILCRVWTKIPPAAKCWLWRLAFLKLLVALVWVTPIRLPMLPALELSEQSSAVSVTLRGPIALDSGSRIDGWNVARPVGPSDSRASGLSATSWVLAVWLLGTVLCTGRLVFEWRYVRRLRRTSLPLDDRRLVNWVRRSCGRLGLRGVPELKVSDTASSPMVLGVRRPVIMLPSRLLGDCSPVELRLAVSHELAHLKRRDLLWNWLPALGHVFFYLHPAVWLARRDWRCWQEMACDELAISVSRASAAELGSLLLKVALGCRASRPVSLGFAEMRGSHSQIERRLVAMRGYDRHGRRNLVGAMVLTFTVGIVGVVPWQVTAQQPAGTVEQGPAASVAESADADAHGMSRPEVCPPVMVADVSEKGEPPEPSTLPLSEFLERAAKLPLGLGEAGLLRAIAELVEREQAADNRGSAVVPRRPLVIRLENVPAVDAARAVEEFLDSERAASQTGAEVVNLSKAVIIAEPISNSLVLSGTPEVVDSLTELIAKLDTAPDTVMVELHVAELLSPSRDSGTDDAASDDSAAPKAPSMQEDGAAWLAWAIEHGRLNTLSRPQIMTRDNQPAYIMIGSEVPLQPESAGPDKGKQIERAFAGLNIELIPRISPDGRVVMELDVNVASVVNRNGAGSPIIARTALQTTVSAEDGQTIVLAGLKSTEDGPREMIYALTPRVNPKL